ncbi:hypothetical protein LCGC14_2848730, partial [marine sediment metagenome]
MARKAAKKKVAFDKLHKTKKPKAPGKTLKLHRPEKLPFTLASLRKSDP